MTAAERRVLVVISAAHALNHAFIKLFPSLLDPIGAETGGDLGALGRVASAQNLAYGLPALLAGWCAGRIGSGRMERGYLLLASVACGLVVLPRGLAGIAGVLFFLGFSCSLYHPAGLSIASRTSRPGTAMAVPY